MSSKTCLYIFVQLPEGLAAPVYWFIYLSHISWSLIGWKDTSWPMRGQYCWLLNTSFAFLDLHKLSPLNQVVYNDYTTWFPHQCINVKWLIKSSSNKKKCHIKYSSWTKNVLFLLHFQTGSEPPKLPSLICSNIM